MDSWPWHRDDSSGGVAPQEQMGTFFHKVAECPLGYSKVTDNIKAFPDYSHVSHKRKTTLKAPTYYWPQNDNEETPPPNVKSRFPALTTPQQLNHLHLRFKCWEVGVYRNAA